VIRAVIDTNVLVSALISSVGNEALVILGVNQGLLIPCFSDEILQEYSEVLRRAKFGFSP
jgi:putative PIN family toxin of toxin-antitoxin system